MIILLKFIFPLLVISAVFYRYIDNHKLSKTALVLLLTSIIFNIALAQNYNFSLIPYPERDGYSISNSLAYYVFGEDHFGHWTSDLFKSGYEISTFITILLLLLFIISLVLDRKSK
jgi:hypothetical protein